MSLLVKGTSYSDTWSESDSTSIQLSQLSSKVSDSDSELDSLSETPSSCSVLVDAWDVFHFLYGAFCFWLGQRSLSFYQRSMARSGLNSFTGIPHSDTVSHLVCHLTEGFIRRIWWHLLGKTFFPLCHLILVVRKGVLFVKILAHSLATGAWKIRHYTAW